MNKKKKLYVGNLDFGVTEEELQNMFSEHGKVLSVKIPVDSMSGRSRGFGFVEMESSEEADKAIEDMDGKEMNGRKINVSIARERSTSERGGGGGGEFRRRY